MSPRPSGEEIGGLKRSDSVYIDRSPVVDTDKENESNNANTKKKEANSSNSKL